MRLMSLWDDVRHAFAGVRRAPTLSAVVIVTLGVGVGGATALVSLLDAFVLRPIAVAHPERLTTLSLTNPRGLPVLIPLEAVDELRRRQHSFTWLCGYTGGGLIGVEVDGTTTQRSIELADAHYFELL